jgi:hypothetical protein
MLLRGHDRDSEQKSEAERGTEHGGRAGQAARRKPRGITGWDASHGRLVVETPFTQGIAGWFGGKSVTLPDVVVSSESPFSVVVATSVEPEPISSTKRLLVTAIGRVEPTGFRWVDRWKREVADPGRPPFLQEPVVARVVWRHKGMIKAYVLDNTGERIGSARLEALAGGEGAALIIDARTAAFHWELTAE